MDVIFRGFGNIGDNQHLLRVAAKYAGHFANTTPPGSTRMSFMGGDERAPDAIFRICYDKENNIVVELRKDNTISRN